MCGLPSVSIHALTRLACLAGPLLWLAACSATRPVAEQEPVAVESAQPEWTATDESTSPEPPLQPASSPPEKVAVLHPDNDANARAEHRLALLETSEDTLETGEVGYYIDVMEARLIQQVRDDSVSIKREGNTFTLLIAGSDAFDSDQSQLKPGVQDALASITGVLEEYRNTQISIYGHTDDTGEDEYNQKLSERRAHSVARYLIEGGIGAERILIIGYGESRPSVVNATAEDRGRNRRIELLLEPLAR